jgi:predicted secreted hydrolase
LRGIALSGLLWLSACGAHPASGGAAAAHRVAADAGAGGVIFQPLAWPRDDAGHFSNTPYASPLMTEWWYFNGKLVSETGVKLAYEVAIFEMQLPTPTGAPTRRYWMQMHVSNLEERRQLAAQAAFASEQVVVSATELDLRFGDTVALQRHAAADGSQVLYTLHTKATCFSGGDDVEVDLELEPAAAPLLVGGEGFIPMPDGGHSYYYSVTRMQTSGSVRLGSAEYRLQPLFSSTWMDHQWGDFLPQEHGWEWFSVRLDNGIDANILVHILRTSKEVLGGVASFILPDGQRVHVALDASFDLGRSEPWTSPMTKNTYPLRHRLHFPTIGLDLDIRAAFAEQDTGGYEGACEVAALYQGDAVRGFSYMELVY